MCVCVVALIVSSSVLGRKRVCDIENTHTRTAVCVVCSQKVARSLEEGCGDNCCVCVCARTLEVELKSAAKLEFLCV